MGLKTAIGQTIYAILFVALLPLGLVAWSGRVHVPFVALHWPLTGLVLTLLGLAILVLGMVTLITRGKGLPMNAFPPEKLVTVGIYSLIPHPIYFGFVLMTLGVSLKYGSATGLWLTTPLALLGCIALVVGYEQPFLLKKHQRLPSPWLDLKPLVILFRLDRLWAHALALTEKTANSWNERRIGPIRIINHGIYGGLAGGAGAWMASMLAGPEHAWPIAFICVSGLLGAALWAQWLEGSSRLLRPFGYYGGVLGIIAGGLVLIPCEKDVLLVFAAWGCAGPFIQAIGRIRCLIQGCCHGRQASEKQGIKITNEHSRVCAIAHLRNTPIYPTQLYSILGNIISGLLILGFWLIAMPLSLIGGMYLITAGLIRFMEEAYRGEPQTRVIFGLPIYQWLAILSVLGGMVVATIASPAAPKIQWAALGLASAIGVTFFFICWFAYGIDFPDSQARFSRLSG